VLRQQGANSCARRGIDYADQALSDVLLLDGDPAAAVEGTEQTAWHNGWGNGNWKNGWKNWKNNWKNGWNNWGNNWKNWGNNWKNGAWLNF